MHLTFPPFPFPVYGSPLVQPAVKFWAVHSRLSKVNSGDQVRVCIAASAIPGTATLWILGKPWLKKMWIWDYREVSPVFLIVKKLKGSWATGWAICTPEAGRVQGDGRHNSPQNTKYLPSHPLLCCYHNLRPNSKNSNSVMRTQESEKGRSSKGVSSNIELLNNKNKTKIRMFKECQVQQNIMYSWLLN